VVKEDNPSTNIIYCGMRDKFCEFATLEHIIYKPYKTVQMAARYLEAARIIGGGKFTKLIPHTTVPQYSIKLLVSISRITSYFNEKKVSQSLKIEVMFLLLFLGESSRLIRSCRTFRLQTRYQVYNFGSPQLLVGVRT